MSSDCQCSRCVGLERVRFYSRQVVTAEDLNAQEDYQRARLRRHNVYLHGFGIVCGLGVTIPKQGFVISVEAGYALSPCGDEVCVPKAFEWDLEKELVAQLPCPPRDLEGKLLVVGVRPVDCPTGAVRVAADRCGCDEGRCEFSRIRETYERCARPTLPQPYEIREAQLADWKLKVERAGEDPPPPPCPPCAEDSCVVLARLQVTGGVLTKVPTPRLVLRSAASWWT